MINPHTEKPGVELRYLRLQPTAFHQRKCMRVGVYGRVVEGEKEEKVESKMPCLDMIHCKDVTTSAIIYTVETKVSREQAGKFNFMRKTWPHSREEKRRVRRADRVETRRAGKRDGNEA